MMWDRGQNIPGGSRCTRSIRVVQGQKELRKGQGEAACEVMGGFCLRLG